ncbi:helix-turn-helix transcriptional regulator [Cronobacter malonaticus]|uniref:helix-turn-helix domain-containing protein n=1 Tax=Cronobacter malonaticus TaxID=413503 RepID=UPI000CFB6D33|nr:helix-turn-helix transcriptional regulator [Cronobacter malonaticus]EKY3230818.1 helix-turn-helix transcriptional regulator [Cronobacter malonaticus]ELY4025655.1 helix-turn-helix transcriptional regulator [Cronobacter malonaticus]MDI7684309.1 helix-turn-helix transcriptional regulator [Cronobacter malonaticus]MDT3582283.1 helix-turn-helix transcriptional regulator [Cronobacter malonaticus]
MSVKGVTFAQVKACALENAAVQAAYEQQIREEELSALLIAMRTQAGLTKNDVAKKMGVSAPEVSQLENNALGVSADTLQSYAQACGVTLKLSLG